MFLDLPWILIVQNKSYDNERINLGIKIKLLYYVVLFEDIVLICDACDDCSESPIDMITESFFSESVLLTLGISLEESINRLLRAFKANNLK